MRSSGRNTGGNRNGKQGGGQSGGAQGGRGQGARGGQGAPGSRQGAQKGRRGTGQPRPEERRYNQPGGGQGGGQGGGRPTGAGSSGSTGGTGGKPRPEGRTGGKPGTGRPAAGRPGTGKPGTGKPGAGKPASGKAPGAGKPGARGGGNVRKDVTKSGAPKARSRNASAPARPREYEAQIEERNRARHTKPPVKLPKTFGEVEGERLQKVLARAGMGSRRACEDLVEQARVEVNGEVILEQGLRVDPTKDEIKVDGLTIAAQSYVFFALNKPAGVVASMEDPEGRQCLGDYVQNRETRLFHVGRLDTETEGLILLTNHGEVAHRLTHPRYGVTKTYLAAIQGPLPRDLGKRLKDGIRLEDGFARADHFKVVENTGKNYLVEVTLHEGRKHIVRRMLAEAGFPVDKLVRTRFGPIALGDQKSGWLRRMTNTEVGMLMNEVGL
ncbi:MULTISPECIES: pseudouridine synthase [unclassified Streptomyces]|uniref:pseudouridine synthase n=1 Tax=unclassified Streptomyces TaxID=2593676 RepID=UPI002DDC2EA9|nr:MULTISPECIES: pseudouridine synthase [unclassified Streptomyces]WSA95739.1 pseudouridine synthase [Streptomyces sp. NBC_01795]WSB80158.1 pseudouridine synthase [Streptomyces sp. NBC_01775]WSS11634.1 pseudouridine synthase [Streptomyces sp. NBC_01186]WSS40348.1 pseudouridine synthase [Streptomyces sp. NBC_01187]